VDTVQETPELQSPGFDNESKAKFWLTQKGFEIQANLGHGAYASVF